MNAPSAVTRRIVATGATLALTVPSALALAGPAAAAPADADATMLQSMAAEEKLAHDVYVTLGARYDARQFDRIAAAESRHLTATRVLLDRYGVVDPTVGDAVGEFDDPDTQALYDSLVRQGSVSLAGAAQVGITVERMDIAGLDAALADTPAADITAVLVSLRRGSQNHLAAFTRLASGQTATATTSGKGTARGPGGMRRGGMTVGTGPRDGNCG